MGIFTYPVTNGLAVHRPERQVTGRRPTGTLPLDDLAGRYPACRPTACQPTGHAAADAHLYFRGCSTTRESGAAESTAAVGRAQTGKNRHEERFP